MKIKTKLLLLTIAVGLQIASYSQDINLKTVTGRILSGENKLPLKGVSVQLKGKSDGVVTDDKGQFSIRAAVGDILVVSNMGFATEEITVGSDDNVVITLNMSFSDMDDVVVVGYGTQKKVNLTGAVSTISAGQIKDRPITSGSQLLQGLSPGVFVSQTSGQPGADQARIRIRGVALNIGGGSSDPFVVIDGIEGNINTINPNDIESVSILKDASASAIYGARAANGVILITTKRGSGKLTTSYDFYFGVTNPTDLPQSISNSGTYMDLVNEMYVNSGSAAPFLQADIDRYKTDPTLPNTDWVDLLFHKGKIQQHNLSISGSGNRSRYAFSVGYLSQDGNIDNYKYQRYNFRLNLDNDVTKNIKVGLNISGYRSVDNRPFGDVNNTFTSALVAQPTTAPYKAPDGRFALATYGPVRDVRSPFTWVDNQSGFNQGVNDNFTGNIFAEIKIIEGLKLKGSAAYRINDGNSRIFRAGWESFRWSPNPTGDEPTVQSEFRPARREESSAESDYRNLYATLDYNKTFWNRHRVGALVGANEEYFYDRGFTGAIQNGFPSPFVDFPQGSRDPVNSTVNGSVSELVVRSYFGRLNYSFDNKYLFEFNLRQDAVSNFSPANRTGNFPSFSVGWNIDRENWFKTGFVDALKLRASWGRLGEYRGISRYAYLALVPAVSGYSFGGTLADAAGTTRMPSSDIVWQTNETLNFGFDAGFFSNKLTATFDYFIKDNINQLGNIPLVALSGLASPIGNPFSIRNQGWELSVGYRNSDRKFTYGVSGNLTHVVNEVTDINGLEIRSGNFIYKEGLPAKTFRLYQVDGIFQSKAEVDAANAGSPTGVYQLNVTNAGDLKYRDVSGPNGKPDGRINDFDRVVTGNPFPKFTYGLSLNAGYMGFDFSMLLQGVSDYDFFIGQFGVEPLQDQIPAKFLNRWTPTNTNTNVYRLTRDVNANNTSGSFPSTYYLQNGSYLRVKNIQLGYSIPVDKISKYGIEGIRIYVNTQNPLTFTKLDNGYDPERLSSADPSGGDERASSYHPQTITTTFGLNIKF